MHDQMRDLKKRFERWRTRSAFTVTTVPNIVSPLAALNNGLDAVRTIKVNPRMVQRGAVTACEQARSACKHVDIVAKSNTTSGWQQAPRQGNYYSDPFRGLSQRDIDAIVAASTAQRLGYGN